MNKSNWYKQNRGSRSQTMRQKVRDIIRQYDHEGVVIRNGDKVKLNIERIMSRNEFNTLQPEYRAFIQDNKDRVFTARVYRRSESGYAVLIELEEDDRWIFWSGDLLRKIPTEESGGVDEPR